jgi:hypothetical protein
MKPHVPLEEQSPVLARTIENTDLYQVVERRVLDHHLSNRTKFDEKRFAHLMSLKTQGKTSTALASPNINAY